MLLRQCRRDEKILASRVGPVKQFKLVKTRRRRQSKRKSSSGGEEGCCSPEGGRACDDSIFSISIRQLLLGTRPHENCVMVVNEVVPIGALQDHPCHINFAV